MKIAMISEYNVYTTIGGTESYIDLLAAGIAGKGHDLLLITQGENELEVEFKSIDQNGRRYNICFIPKHSYNVQEVRQQVASSTWPKILAVLRDFKPDIIHVHTLSTFFNIRHIEECAKSFPQIVFTSHVAGHFCRKGDLIQNDLKPCNGIIAPIKCSVCLFTQSAKTGVSNLLFQHYRKPLDILQKLSELGVYINTPAIWQKFHLIENGYEASKINVIGIPLRTADYAKADSKQETQTLSIGYLGRLSPEKGSLLLLKMIRALSARPGFRFVIAIPKNSAAEDVEKLQQIIDAGEADIVLLKNITAQNKHEFFEKIHCLFVPSLVVEPGPTVVLEALFYNKNVVAPNVGGSQEFGQIFPENVFNYKWNNLSSAITVIENLRNKADGSPRNYEQYFAFQEEAFVDKHLAIYEEVVSSTVLPVRLPGKVTASS